MDVFEIVGEPAIVINGVPNFSPSSVTSIIMNKGSALEANKDPGFGEWLEGREVKRLFEGQFYSGKVVRYDSKSEWYRVAYENGDLEDIEWHELKEALLPLDFSTSLVTLASQRCKSMQSYSEYSLLEGKTKKRHRKSIESTEKTIALLEAPPSIESRDNKLVEAKHSSQRIRQIQTRSRTATSQLAKPELSIIPYLEENTASAGGIAKRTRRGKNTGAVSKAAGEQSKI